MNAHDSGVRRTRETRGQHGAASGRLLLVWWLLLAAATVVLAEPAAEFEAANKLFEQGKFAEAANAYEQLLTNGCASAAVHFNLGNACFKNSQPGRAIFHYHQALRLTPRDPDVRANLQFVRRSLGVTREENFGSQWLQALTLNEWAWLAGGSVGAWFLLLAVGELVPGKRSALAGVTKPLGIAALVSAALLTAAHTVRQLKPAGVVIIPEAPVRPGPLPESKALFSLRDGTEVAVLDQKDQWLQVRAGSQQTGWLKQTAILRWE